MKSNNETNLKLSPPWEIYRKQITILFDQDPEIEIKYDADNYTLKLYVDNYKKAFAISEILPMEKSFGNILFKTQVIPSNSLSLSAYTITSAFSENPIVNYIGIENDKLFVVFKNKVVQYFNDNICDANRVESTLYQNIADNVLINREGIFFCTDIEGK